MWQKQGPPQHTAPYLSSGIVEIYCVLLSLINIIYCFPPQCIRTHSVQTVLCIRGVQTLSSNQSTDVIVSLESPTAVQVSKIQHGNQWPESYEGVSSSMGTFTLYPRGWFLLTLTDINCFFFYIKVTLKLSQKCLIVASSSSSSTFQRPYIYRFCCLTVVPEPDFQY